MARETRGLEWDRFVRRIGFALLQLERYTPGGVSDVVELTELRFKLDADNRTSVLCVVKAVVAGEHMVGFVGAGDLSATVVALAKKVVAGNVRWREDRPYVPPKGRSQE